MIFSVVAPLTVVTSALYFFGWIRTRALFGHFGVDVTFLGFTSADYVLRSAETVFRPIVVLALFAAFASFGANFLIHKARQRKGRRALAVVSVQVVLSSLGLGLLIIAASGFTGSVPATVSSCSLGVGALALYIVFRMHLARVRVSLTASYQYHGAIVAAVISLVVISIFWASAVYAQRDGEQLASGFASGSLRRPEITIYSRAALDLPVQGERLPVRDQSEKPFLFKYSRLRLLAFASGKFFIIGPPGSVNFPTIVLRDEDSIRIELKR